MARLITVCSVICLLAMKIYQTFIVLKGATYVIFAFKIHIALMFLCNYIIPKVSSCVTFSVIFATRASIIYISLGTHDMIRISSALTIQFFDILIKHHTSSVQLFIPGYVYWD